MDFRVLGPLEVLSERGVVHLEGQKPRAVLAVLLLHANEPVSSERLVEAVWGEEESYENRKSLQVSVSRLRKALDEPGIVATKGKSYEVRVRPGELDAECFERLVEDGRNALAAGHPEQAAAALREGLALWRGPALADLAFESFAEIDIARLEEQRVAALEMRVDADLAAARHAELVGELRQLLADNPTRERFAAQLMLALYRCGRQTEALEAYRRARERLVEEIGVEPAPELRRMHEAILRQDPSLEPPAPRLELPRELDSAAAPGLVGRDAELGWLRERWQRAEGGTGSLVTMTGREGMGKSRLAAELARDVHRHGASVFYAAGAGPAHAALAALRGASEAGRPTLMVLDDADRAGDEVLTELADLTRILPSLPMLALATAERGDATASLGADGTLDLGPLDAEAIREIGADYLSDPERVDNVPAESLLETSEGVPRRIHELVSQWARQEASRRVDEVAGRTAAGRAELRSMENELAGGVVELQRADERLALVGDKELPVVCPFKGLAPFDVDDAEYFFGRERLVAELVARLVGTPLLGVVGPSGSGKSSVVRAGLLPALAGGVLPGSDNWKQVLIRPGEHPLSELRSALADVDPGGKVVLAVDQFEETFTACRDESERAAFISQLVDTPKRAGGAVVVVALRADFYGRCAAYPDLSRLLAENHVLVGAMHHVELRRAVVGPAERVGLEVEPELVEALVNDVEDEPGELPLLSSALLELWQRRDGRRLRLAAYESTGGVRGAVARLAENGFGRLDETQQAVARTVFLRLAEVEIEGGVERRRLPREDVEDGRGDVADVINLLADGRLLTVSAGSVEFAHEALLREWPRLRDWIDDDREDLRIHRNLSSAAGEWERLGRDESVLYRGSRLAEAREWSRHTDLRPTDLEREFLRASLARERRERGARRRRLRLAFGALSLGIVAIGAIALVALDQRSDAEHQRNIAVSRELALESAGALHVDPELALRLALWANDTAPTEQAGAALREATLAFRPYYALRADPLDANAASYSPDGKRVVTGGTAGRALVWDTATRRRVDSLDAGHDAVLAARYSPSGDRIALGFEDGTLAITDPSLGDPHEILHVKGQDIHDVAFSHDGARIAAALEDGSVRVLAVDGSGPVQRLSGHDGAVLGVDISADGSRIVSAGEDGSVRLWRATNGGSGQILHSGGTSETDVAFSPDGERIAAVGDDRRVRLWDGQTGVEEESLSGEGRQLLAVAFSADGRRFAAAGRDGVTRVWSVEGGPPVAVLRGQGARVYDVGFGPSSDRVVSAADDGTVRIWDAGRTQAWSIPSLTYDIEFNRDGRLLESSSDDGTTRVWDPSTGRLRASLPGPQGRGLAGFGRFSPTSDTLVISSNSPRVRLWPVSAPSAEVAARLPEGRRVVFARFDPTGNRIVYTDDRGRVAIRDLRSGREVTLGGTPKLVWAAEWGSDGKHIFVVPDNDVLVWDIDHPARPQFALKGHDGSVHAMDFSRDGRILTAGEDRTARIWDERGKQLVVMRGHEDELTNALFTADGSQVLSSSQDGSIRLFDAHTGTQLAAVQSAEGELYDVALSRDGTIATLGKGEVVRVFRCEVCGSLDQVRALALSRSPRPLTAEEREQFLAATE
jgi:WD40 repeat protein/DNA-binding SARP family transcriptional activator